MWFQSKLIVDIWFDSLSERENPESYEFTHYDRSFGKRSRIDRVYNDIKIANNTKINHIMVSFTDHYNAISLISFPSKTKNWKRLMGLQ